MNRVIHFEVAADDPEKAIAFYQQVFGWEVKAWEGPEAYWLVTTGPNDERGVDGAITKSREGWPRMVNTIEVGSVDEYAEKVSACRRRDRSAEDHDSRRRLPGLL